MAKNSQTMDMNAGVKPSAAPVRTAPKPVVSQGPGFGSQGGSGVQRPKRKNLTAWRVARDRRGATWFQRKVKSHEYCPTNKK